MQQTRIIKVVIIHFLCKFIGYKESNKLLSKDFFFKKSYPPVAMILICLKLEYTKVEKFAVMLLNTTAPMAHHTAADLRQPRPVGKLLKGTSV